MDAIKTLLAQVNTFWAAKSKAFQRNTIIIAVAAVAVIILLSVVFTRTDYAPLYTNLSSQEAGDLLQTLNTLKEPARVTGSNVEVPSVNVDRLRMTLSSQGFPKSSKNMDFVKQGQGITMTEKDKQVYIVAQRESDLQNAIKTFSGVKDAVVNLIMPEESPLVISSNRQEPSASVILTLDNSIDLSGGNIKAIAQFVQKSVANLKLENISIVDSNMNILDFGNDVAFEDLSDHAALQKSVQDRLQKQVMSLLQPVFGMGKVQTQVNVTLDFEDRTTDTVKFEPPVAGSKDGIIVSIDKLREQIKNSGGATQPGTSTNTGSTTYPVLNTDNGTYSKNQDKINYELNTIKEHIVKEKGSIKSLSVSVVIDSTDAKDDYSENVKNLVASAVGVDKANIAVENLPMSGNASVAAMAEKASQQAADQLKATQMRYIISIAAVVLLALAGMFMVFRNRSMRHKASLAAANALTEAAHREVDDDQSDMEPAAAISLVGDSEAKSQIGKFIESNPELVTNLLRSWLADDQE